MLFLDNKRYRNCYLVGCITLNSKPHYDFGDQDHTPSYSYGWTNFFYSYLKLKYPQDHVQD